MVHCYGHFIYSSRLIQIHYCDEFNEKILHLFENEKKSHNNNLTCLMIRNFNKTMHLIQALNLKLSYFFYYYYLINIFKKIILYSYE